ncbi:Frag1/DRAM/Sfk1-like protein [Aureococcus anophagefferens]|nr:Frag1/DRAM/Sfk1-like protein [Aureococcus anophagefferens]
MLVVSLRERPGLVGLAVASCVCTALRAAPPGLDVTPNWALAVFEWSNVGLVCAWTVLQLDAHVHPECADCVDGVTVAPAPAAALATPLLAGEV